MAMSEQIDVVRLVRHGESVANAGHATADPGNIPLSALGQKQAEALSHSVRTPPSRIVCSPFLRARQTAEPVARRFGLRPEIWPIQEFTYLAPGRCVGTTGAERRLWVEEFWEKSDPNYVDGPGAESFVDLIERVRMALGRLESCRGGILMIGHGQFMQALRWWHSQQPATLRGTHMQAFRQGDVDAPIKNCEGYVLQYAEKRWLAIQDSSEVATS